MPLQKDLFDEVHGSLLGCLVADLLSCPNKSSFFVCPCHCFLFSNEKLTRYITALGMVGVIYCLVMSLKETKLKPTFGFMLRNKAELNPICASTTPFVLWCSYITSLNQKRSNRSNSFQTNLLFQLTNMSNSYRPTSEGKSKTCQIPLQQPVLSH